MFKKYNSLINHYKTSDIDKWILYNPEIRKEKYIVTEKIHGCLDYDTQIETLEFGILTIGYIVENKISCMIKSFDFELNEIIYLPITNWFINDNSSEWFLIELENGIKLKVTENHYIWIPKLKSFRQVKDLIIGDELLLT
jgi:hypothetical protein